MAATTFVVVIESDVDIDRHDVRIALATYFKMDGQRVLVSSGVADQLLPAPPASADHVTQLLGTIKTLQETQTYQRMAHQALNDNLTAMLRRLVALEAKVYSDG